MSHSEVSVTKFTPWTGLWREHKIARRSDSAVVITSMSAHIRTAHGYVSAHANHRWQNTVRDRWAYLTLRFIWNGLEYVVRYKRRKNYTKRGSVTIARRFTAAVINGDFDE